MGNLVLATQAPGAALESRNLSLEIDVLQQKNEALLQTTLALISILNEKGLLSLEDLAKRGVRPIIVPSTPPLPEPLAVKGT
jgi:hypothetical protein